MYRKDVLERIYYVFKKGGTKPNFAKLAREMGRDCRTVKRAYEAAQGQPPGERPPRKAKPRKIDPRLETIRRKVEMGCSYVSIFKFIAKEEGYDGCLTSVKYECERIADEKGLPS